LSQTPPRNSLGPRSSDSREKPSEWPQFSAAPRGPDSVSARSDRRTVTTPSLNLPSNKHDMSLGSKLSGSVSASTTPLLQQHQQSVPYLSQGTMSRRGSPPSLDTMSAITVPRSVPATPIPGISTTPSHMMKAPGTPLSSESQGLSGRLSSAGVHSMGDSLNNGSDLRPSLSRLSSQYENGPLGFNAMQSNLDDALRVGFFSTMIEA
jgi:hypothetical protein